MVFQALALNFANYRTVRGDGNCGWRGTFLLLVDSVAVFRFHANVRQALAFGYFEALVHSGGPSRFWAEIARLRSLNNLLDSVGYQREIYEDFVEETMQLHKQIIGAPPDQDIPAALLASFNNPEVSSAIIMHFRVSARDGP